MQNKSKKLIPALLALTLALILFAAIPLTASAADGPFQVTMQPVGATYRLNEAAIPLKATFSYKSNAGLGFINPDADMKVKWYWSENNSNTSRANGLGESAVAYAREITHTTTQVPATNAYGVKYYYAVLSYVELVDIGTDWIRVPREAVTNPAKIEVLPETTGFEIIKTDEDGKPLAGAVFELASASDPTKSYTSTSDSSGFAQFAAEDGYYILSEKQAPAGYTASTDTYHIMVSGGDVYFYEPGTQRTSGYELITFVNKKAAAPPGNSITVKKTDADDKPLAGATMRVEGKTDAGIPRVIDVKTDSKGEAVFTLEKGTYKLSEHAAPSGYNASSDSYDLAVTDSGVSIKDSKGALTPYTPVTFVNKKIPGLNKDDHFAYMQGYPEGTFYPGRNMTRAEAVVMFSRLLAEEMDLDKDFRSNYYPDVDLKTWYANQVCYMHQLGVLADFCRGGKFRPNDQVTRAEFATLAAHFDNLVLSKPNTFTDVADDHWAVKYINSAAAKGWIVGDPGGTFRPEDKITRAEVVTLVNRILERKADRDYITANAKTLPRSYSDTNALHWAYWDIMESSIGHDFVKEGAGEKWTLVYK